MKKILIILLAILCIPISGFVMSLSILENNPNRYIEISELQGMTVYLDSDSIQSLVYNPPYYRMKITAYNVINNLKMIYAISWVFDYDYYYSAKSTSDRILAEMSENNEPMTKDMFSEKLEHNLREQTGIEMTMDPLAVWTTKGQLISNNKKYIKNAINDFLSLTEWRIYMIESFRLNMTQLDFMWRKNSFTPITPNTFNSINHPCHYQKAAI